MFREASHRQSRLFAISKLEPMPAQWEVELARLLGGPRDLVIWLILLLMLGVASMAPVMVL